MCGTYVSMACDGSSLTAAKCSLECNTVTPLGSHVRSDKRGSVQYPSVWRSRCRAFGDQVGGEAAFMYVQVKTFTKH